MRGITRGAKLMDDTSLARRGRIVEYGGAEDRAEACRHVRSVTRTGVPNLVTDAYFGRSIREMGKIEIQIEISSRFAISTVTRLVTPEAARITGKFSSRDRDLDLDRYKSWDAGGGPDYW